MIKTADGTFFRNFSNPLRVEIINLLIKKNMYVNEISRELNVEQSKISHALSNLKKSNIVHSRRRGKKRIYSLNKKAVLPILRFASKHIAQTAKKEPEC